MPIEGAAREDPSQKHFSDPDAVARYFEGPQRFVPGLDALHRMTGVLLAERAPIAARVLVLGAGGGSELRALAEAHPQWTFVGVDPAAEMLRLAERTVGLHMDWVELVEGYIDDCPAGPFDAAVCLLTLHFLPASERERTVRQIHDRLRPGAPFVAAHVSFHQGDGERDVWLDRYAAYPIASGVDPDQVGKARAAVAASLNTLSPEQDEAVLRGGGFHDVHLFYTGLVWRGWIARA
jgi:tRNA (cmo5U34)-methyltransferase